MFAKLCSSHFSFVDVILFFRVIIILLSVILSLSTRFRFILSQPRPFSTPEVARKDRAEIRVAIVPKRIRNVICVVVKL